MFQFRRHVLFKLKIKTKMAFRRVLAIYKCSCFTRTDKHTSTTKLKQTKSESVGERNTLSLFAIYIMANLFHGVLDKSL